MIVSVDSFIDRFHVASLETIRTLCSTFDINRNVEDTLIGSNLEATN